MPAQRDKIDLCGDVTKKIWAQAIWDLLHLSSIEIKFSILHEKISFVCFWMYIHLISIIDSKLKLKYLYESFRTK